jgi:hypothetical protein
MTLFELSSILGALGGAIGLGIALASRGPVVAIMGIVGGLLAGWFVAPFLVLACFLVGIAFQEGLGAALAFLRQRRR